MKTEEIKELCDQLYSVMRRVSEAEIVLLKELHKAREQREAIGKIVGSLQSKCDHEFMEEIRVCRVCKFVGY